MSRWFAGVCLMVSMVAPGVGAQPRTLVLEGGTLIDGTGRQPLANAVVVVEGTRISVHGAVYGNLTAFDHDGNQVEVPEQRPGVFYIVALPVAMKALQWWPRRPRHGRTACCPCDACCAAA